jgi:hypothetical protein
MTALQTALGDQVAAIALRRQNFSPDQKLYVIDQMLDALCPGVRDAAYMAADLPTPPLNEEGKEDLTEQEFNTLTTRIINTATKNNIPVHDALCATAKAMGAMICILAERPDISLNDLVKCSQQAIPQFTQDAIATRVAKGCLKRSKRRFNAGHDTRALQAYLGHKNIQHTVRYTDLAPDRFRDFWR